MSNAPSVAALEGAHDFPTWYPLKVLGSNSPAFVEAARERAVEVLGEFGQVKVSTRTSSGGKYVAVTLDVFVVSAEQVRSLYFELKELRGLKMLL